MFIRILQNQKKNFQVKTLIQKFAVKYCVLEKNLRVTVIVKRKAKGMKFPSPRFKVVFCETETIPIRLNITGCTF